MNSITMVSDLQLQKKLLSPPGDTIQETIEAYNMSQAELAERMGRPKEKLNDIIKGREPITPKTSLLLERVLGIPVSFWMNREREYREEIMRIEQLEFLESCIDWLNDFPIPELKKLNYLSDTRDKTIQVDELLKFFSVASPGEWENIYLNESVTAAFKISLANTQSPYAISAWLRIGELEARKKQLADFDKPAFSLALENIKKLVVKQPSNFAGELEQICAKCGVAVIYTPCLPKAPISGATWWKGGNPIIQLSGRYKTNDSFWFAFYHEAGHILLHGKKDVFLEELSGSPIDKEKEEEANLFAQKHLFPEAGLKALLANQPIDDDDIVLSAKKFNTHPAIIVGQLQHAGILMYSEGNHFKIPVDLF